MAEYRKYIQTVLQSPVSNSDGSTSRKVGSSSKSSRSKQPKNRLLHTKSKQTFLTDTQTSDYTKSSNQCGPSISSQTLQQTIRSLKRQNYDLKQQIIQMKSNEYFNINSDKLKDLIVDNEKLKNQLTKMLKKVDQLTIEKDFLERFNKNLKTQCQQLTRQVVQLSKKCSNTINDQRSPRNTAKVVDFDDNAKRVERFSVKHLEDMYKSRGSHRSQQPEEKLAYKPRDSSKSRAKQNQKLLKKSRSTSRVLDNQYFIGKGLRQQPRKHKKSRKLQDQ